MPNPNEDNPIQKLWEYIPPYTAPNYPPHVEVITTTNTGDTPMTDEPDIVERLRNYNTCSDTDVDEAADEIEQMRKDWKVFALSAQLCIDRLTAERDEARRRVCEMLHEEGYGRSPEEWAKRKGWDCFKENNND